MPGSLAAVVRCAVAAVAASLFPLAAAAQDLPRINVGVLAFGTAQWEMKVIRDHQLDRRYGFDLVLRNLGSDDAGDIALQTGDVDVILTDFIWVSIQRNRGADITLVPHSRAVGGLMVAPDGGIGTIGDLPGRTIGIAGGPTDKSWIILQAYWARDHDTRLADEVEARFAPPPMVNELLKSGKLDAGLNFWHYNARSKAARLKELVSVSDMLTALGLSDQAPLLGWAFREKTAAAKPEALRGFLDASFAAKAMLLDDDAVWDELRGLMKAEGDDALFRHLRDDYRAGIITGYDAATIDAARQTFALMAEYGGAELVGDVPTLAEGTFWSGYAGPGN